MSDVWSPPRAQLQDPSLAGADAVDMRRRHINHEASVRSVGLLYYLGGVLLTLTGVSGLVGGVNANLGGGIVIFAFLVAVGALQFWIGHGVRALKSWVKIPVGVFSGIGLLGFPLGTLINGYILYLVFSAKGTTVFSEEYQQVIAATPDVKYKTSIAVWIFLGLLLLLIAVMVFSRL